VEGGGDGFMETCHLIVRSLFQQEVTFNPNLTY